VIVVVVVIAFGQVLIVRLVVCSYRTWRRHYEILGVSKAPKLLDYDVWLFVGCYDRWDCVFSDLRIGRFAGYYELRDFKVR